MTEEQIKQEKERLARIAAKADEFKALVGKTFRRKIPNSRIPNQYFLVTGYVGTPRHGDGIQYHTIQVESQNPAESKWTPPAVKFLEEFEPCEIAATATNPEPL